MSIFLCQILFVSLVTESIHFTIMPKNYINMTQNEVDEKMVDEMVKYIKAHGIPRIIYSGFGEKQTDNTYTEK